MVSIKFQRTYHHTIYVKGFPLNPQFLLIFEPHPLLYACFSARNNCMGPEIICSPTYVTSFIHQTEMMDLGY